jgi:Flp pilus assembly protein TadD
MFRPRSPVVAVFVVVLSAASLHAGDVRVPLPKKSKYTPVQKLNRDGVTAIEKHQYDKAKRLFYKAYLIDPNDPFTLNNLGYLAEMEGDGDRAQRFYQLASDQSSDAVIDKASNELVEGKPVSAVAGNAEAKGINVNRLNSQAIALLNKDRAPEADLVLQKALLIDARNPFTLNNLGYAKEKEGELSAAYQLYTAAANTNSGERIMIAANKDWRGREISSVARDNARKLDRRMHDGEDTESRVALLNLRGVSAFNRNDRRTARDYIQQAFKLDPTNAFTLNNMGFLAEMDGDRETADYYYDRARDANRNSARISLATRKDVEGKKIGEVAENTDNRVLNRMELEQQARQALGGPVMLRKRDNTPIVEPAQPAVPPRKYQESDENGNLLLPPLPSEDTSQPTGQNRLAMPLPENQQPKTVHQGDEDNGLIMPLPDNQQPVQQAKPQPGYVPPQNPQQPSQNTNDKGLMMPLPDNQQPVMKPAHPPAPAMNPVNPPAPSVKPANPGVPASAPPAQPQPKPQPQGGPGLLLPVPDSRQQSATPTPSAPAQNHVGTQPTPPQSSGTTPSATPQKSGGTQQNNGGVYAPPTGPNNTPPKPPKKITDEDTAAPKKTSDKANPKQSNTVTRISDQ